MMLKQIVKTELIKLKGYPTFWTIIGVHSALFVLVILIALNISVDIQGVNALSFFKAKYIWSTTAWIASWFNLLLGILVIILVGNETQYGTIRRQLLDGFPRNGIVAGKLLVITMLTVYSMVLVLVASLLTTLFTHEALSNELLTNSSSLLVFGLQSFSYMVVAMLFATLFKNNALSSILYLLYFLLIEPIILFFIPSPANYYFPAHTISKLTPTPNFMGMLTENLAQADGITNESLQQLNVAGYEPSTGTIAIVVTGYLLIILATIFTLFRRKDF